MEKVLFLKEKRPRKTSPILVENAWEQRMFTTMQKKGQLILKTPLAILKNADV